jgi:hypothetical protein
MQDSRSGHNQLDRRLVIQSTSETAAAALLCHPGVQTSLLQVRARRPQPARPGRSTSHDAIPQR